MPLLLDTAEVDLPRQEQAGRTSQVLLSSSFPVRRMSATVNRMEELNALLSSPSSLIFSHPWLVQEPQVCPGRQTKRIPALASLHQRPGLGVLLPSFLNRSRSMLRELPRDPGTGAL